MSATTPPADVKLRVLAAARRVPSPTRRKAALQTRVYAMVSLAAGLCVFFGLGGLSTVPGPFGYRFGAAVGWLFVALGATWATVARDKHRVLGRSPAWLAAVALGVPFVLLGWMSLWELSCPDVWPQRVDWACLGVSLAIATLPFLTLMSARQHSDPAHPATAGAALGATAGAWSGVLVSLWCPVPHPMHVLVGHLLPVMLLAILGAALGRRVVGFRAAGSWR
jgi:hypothetical protein